MQRRNWMGMVALLAMLMLGPVTTSAQVTNSQIGVMSTATRTALQINSSDLVNSYYRGTHLVITVTGWVSGTYTVTLQGKNVSTGNYYDLLVSPAIGANGQTVLKVYPGAAIVVNGSASDFLPSTWRVQLNGANSPNMTIAVDAMMAGG